MSETITRQTEVLTGAEVVLAIPYMDNKAEKLALWRSCCTRMGLSSAVTEMTEYFSTTASIQGMQMNWLLEMKWSLR